MQVSCVSLDNAFATVQSEVTEINRRELVVWIMQICDDYVLESSTLFLCIHLIDSFLRFTDLSKQKFQLIGCTCLVIAAKLNEVHVSLVFSHYSAIFLIIFSSI
jgi:Cyclin, N-terminal domain